VASRGACGHSLRTVREVWAGPAWVGREAFGPPPWGAARARCPLRVIWMPCRLEERTGASGFALTCPSEESDDNALQHDAVHTAWAAGGPGWLLLAGELKGAGCGLLVFSLRAQR